MYKDDELFIIIEWPDIQAYMELEGFEENACLANDYHFVNNYGSSAHFVNLKWLKSLDADNRNKVMKNLQDT